MNHRSEVDPRDLTLMQGARVGTLDPASVLRALRE